MPTPDSLLRVNLLIGGVAAVPRFDLGAGVYRAMVDGRVRFYRCRDPQAESPVTEDVTEEMTREALRRQKRAAAVAAATAAAARVQAARVGAARPTELRGQHAAGMAEELSDAAGVTRVRARSVVDVMAGRKDLTMRQASAGRALYDDWARRSGARDLPEERLDTPSLFGLDDMLVIAGRRLAAARRACEAVVGLAVPVWPVVELVVLHEFTVTQVVARLTRSKTRSAATPVAMALLCGLDAVGDAYGMASDFQTGQVFVRGFTVLTEFVQEGVADDEWEGGWWRSRSLHGRPWHRRADTMGALYKAARDELHEAVERILGPGDHPPAAIGRALEAHRADAAKRASRAALARAQRRADRLAELVAERSRVLQHARAG